MSQRSLRMRRPPAIGRLRPTLLRSARPAVPAPPSWRRSIPGRTAAPFRPRAGAPARGGDHQPAIRQRSSHAYRHLTPCAGRISARQTPQPLPSPTASRLRAARNPSRREEDGIFMETILQSKVTGYAVGSRWATGSVWGALNEGFRKKALLCRKRFLGQPGNSRQLRGLERRYAAPGPCRAAPDAARSVRLCDGRYRNARASMSRPLLPPRLGPAPLPACLSGPGIEHNPPPRLLSHASALRKG